MEPVRYQTAQEHTYAFLREAILTGAYPGGMRVDIPALAERLGVSRMPVREALRQLAAEGLVTIRPNRGVVVTRLTLDDVLEVFEMRAVLEGLAVRVGLPRLDEAAFAQLGRICQRMERQRGHAARWLRLHHEFHDYICRRSGRPRLVAQTALLRRTVEPYLRLHLDACPSEELLGSEHPHLLEILRTRDPERGERAMREHVEQAAAHIVAVLKTAVAPVPPPPESGGGDGGPRPRRSR